MTMNEIERSFNGSDDLWSKIINEGIEDRVEVNQRMLIDKMLARYSSDFVVYRELIQNSDDAQATSFILQIICDPLSSITQSYQNIQKDHSKKHLLNTIGQFIQNRWTTTNDSISSSSSLSKEENSFDNCLIKEIRTINNGQIFNDDDWKRVITIAEGNNNVDAIGQFGVGFFSVFSYSEKPMIQSGKYCLAFLWQNGKSLTTFRKELSFEEQQQSNETSIILPMKNSFLLQTKSLIHSKDQQKIDSNRSTKSKQNIITNEIIPTMDLNQLKSYFTKVLSFTKYIQQLTIQINGRIIFQVNKIIQPIQSNKLSLAVKRLNSNSEHSLLQFQSLIQTEQIFSILNGPKITLNHIDVEARVVIDKDFHKKIEGVLKKSLPSTIHIQFLFPSNTIFEEEQWKALEDNELNNHLLKNLIPLKFVNEKIHPSGQIFIGLATHQSTGIGMHISSHLIPTIERENIDLQDPYISIWNEQLLISIGQLIRFIYDQTILQTINQIDQQSNQRIQSILSPYAFQESSPNKQIGRILVDGFFSSDKDILVPVKRLPSDKHLSLIPSTEAYLTSNKYLETFLPLALIPFEIGKNDFFQILKKRQWICEITNDIILYQINQSILLFDQLIELLHWLCTIDKTEKLFLKKVLSHIRYRQNIQSSNIIIELNQIEYFDTLNLPSSLPLPSNVFSSNIVSHISQEDLQKHLGLTIISIKDLILFYLQEKQQILFMEEKTSQIILHFICQHSNKFNSNELIQMKNYLATLKCISTTKGMKFPHESYIPSINLSSHLPIIIFYIPQIINEHKEQQTNEYPISLEFLKSIGCRTIHIPTLTNQENTSTTSTTTTTENLQTFIENLLKQRRNLSTNDLRALKTTHCIQGTTLDLNEQMKRKYLPSELHFPSVGKRLQWLNLPIIDWFDIDYHSNEYGFLKELGVKEVPDIDQLISRIDYEHCKSSKSKQDYQLPLALRFFAEHFQEHYSKIWKNLNIKMSFLPSISPDFNQLNEVILTRPDQVYKEYGPLCPSLHIDVIRCFSDYFDISLIGVKHRPLISIAFSILMEKRNELLNVQSASNYFSYLNKLDGLNRTFIQSISNQKFIPLSENSSYMKSSEVFLRSKSISSTINKDKDKEDLITRGLIDYIDYGYEANCFLTSIGVVCYPTAENLAYLLIQRHGTYFNSNDEKNILEGKLNLYTNCLKQLAVVSNVAREFQIEPLNNLLKTKSWCLAYQIIDKLDGNKERIFKIAKPNEIYLDDDHQSSIDLRPLCAPEEPQLTKLYEQFGSKWISESVQRTLIHKGKVFITDRSKKLEELIEHRFDMLFVNNRGERIENIDDKRIVFLRTKFHVYESESIQCQLTFQNRTITLNSTECSSCALEYDQKQVILFLQKDLSTIDYIDIATELTRFIYQKPIDSLVHSISDKLASPLETLKRRGIPVDRLLKIQEQQPIQLTLPSQQPKIDTQQQPRPISQPSQSQPQHLEDDYQEQSINEKPSSRKFLQSLKDLLIPVQIPSPSIPTNSIEKPLSSQIQTDRVTNFGQYKCDDNDDDNDIKQMIGTSRPYSQIEFNQTESSRNEINNSCEFIPASNMIRHSDLLHGIPLYIDKNITLTNLMIDQGKQFAFLLSALAKQVFQIPLQTMHLFRDIDSARIAFNSHGALFFNLRYFEQVYWDDLKSYLGNASSSSASIPIVRRIVNFYFIVTCHELSHNIDSNHDLNFINRLERVSVRFMDARDAFISTFAFP